MNLPTKSTTSSLDRVLIVPHAQLRGLFRGIIEALLRAGSEIMLVTTTEQQTEFWRQRFASQKISIATNNIRYSTARAPVTDESSLFANARRIEVDLGIKINRLAVRDRILGRGYAPGGLRHPRSRLSKNATYPQLVAAFIAEIEFWEETLSEFNPTVAINCGQICNLLVDRLGIPYRRLMSSRTGNLYQWAENDYYENPAIISEYSKLRSAKAEFEPHILNRPYRANEIVVGGFAERHSIPQLAKQTAMLGAQYLYWHLRGYEKAHGYYLRDQISLIWRRRAEWRRQSGRNTVKLSDLRAHPFVFFPLQTEPEVALQGLSPEYTFQLETIISLSRELPAGYLLAVKDTPVALGRRPISFYQQIAELKNAVMLDIKEWGVDVINASQAVATICGSAGFEGAISGKPVIVFGSHNPYDVLPHVSRVGRDGTLEECLERTLCEEFDHTEAQLEGVRFLEAIKRVSFQIQDVDVFKPEDTHNEAIDGALKMLQLSLTREPVSPAPV